MNRNGLIVAQFFLLGCVAENDARLKKVTELDNSVASLLGKVAVAQSSIESLQKSVLMLEVQAKGYTTTAFDPGSPGGYSRIDTKGGTFLVSIQNVEPYVEGFHVTCKFGNPSSATFNGFKLKAKWGPRLPQDSKIFLQWHAALREKELSLIDTLQAGSWNRVSFVLSPATAEEFGYLELSMETDNVSLRQ